MDRTTTYVGPINLIHTHAFSTNTSTCKLNKTIQRSKNKRLLSQIKMKPWQIERVTTGPQSHLRHGWIWFKQMVQAKQRFIYAQSTYLDCVVDVDDIAAVESWGRQRRDVDDVVIEGVIAGLHFAPRDTEHVALAAVFWALGPNVDYLSIMSYSSSSSSSSSSYSLSSRVSRPPVTVNYGMLLFRMTLSDPGPNRDFKVTLLFDAEYHLSHKNINSHIKIC